MADEVYRFASYIDVENAKVRMQAYQDSAEHVYDTFQRYGLQVYSGAPTEQLFRLCAETLRDVRLKLATDRAEISDHFAVVPNYYVALNNEGLHKAWASYERKVMRSKVEDDDEEIGDPPAMTLTYSVGLELVIRDFRNFEYISEGNVTDSRSRFLTHPTGQPFPPVASSEHGRLFDVPIGLITSVNLDRKHSMLHLKAKGACGEPVKLSVGLKSELVGPMPIGDRFDWFDENGEPKDALSELRKVGRTIKDI